MKQRKRSTLKDSDEAIWTAVTSYMDSSHNLIQAIFIISLA